MTTFQTDLEAELENIARLGAVLLPSADPAWLIPRMEKFEAWARAELGDAVEPRDVVMLGQNIHIYLLELLAQSVSAEFAPEIREAAIFGFEASMRRRTVFGDVNGGEA